MGFLTHYCLLPWCSSLSLETRKDISLLVFFTICICNCHQFIPRTLWAVHIFSQKKYTQLKCLTSLKSRHLYNSAICLQEISFTWPFMLIAYCWPIYFDNVHILFYFNYFKEAYKYSKKATIYQLGFLTQTTSPSNQSRPSQHWGNSLSIEDRDVSLSSN